MVVDGAAEAVLCLGPFSKGDFIQTVLLQVSSSSALRARIGISIVQSPDLGLANAAGGSQLVQKSNRYSNNQPCIQVDAAADNTQYITVPINRDVQTGQVWVAIYTADVTGNGHNIIASATADLTPTQQASVNKRAGNPPGFAKSDPTAANAPPTDFGQGVIGASRGA